MPVSMFILLPYLLLIGSARENVSAPNCTDSTFTWSYNSLLQNPCMVGAYLEAVCDDLGFSVPSLPSGRSYSGPNAAEKDNMCQCNTVVYNLISACGACQGEPWISYSTWSFNCTTNATAGTFPKPVPTDTRVPHWAYIDTSISDSWNISAAQLAGVNPEVTATGSASPTSTSTVAKSTPTSHHSSNAGAIAGGVVGGIIGAALITGVIVWFSIRRRRARSSPYLDFKSGEKEQPPPHPPAGGAPKFYDPSDPSTYPSKEYLPVVNPPSDSTGHLQPSDGGYSGLPEI